MRCPCLALFVALPLLAACGSGSSPCDADDDGYASTACGGCDNDDGDPTSPGVLWYGDLDGDGHGALTEGVASCDPPSGLVKSHDDCDDADPSINPEAEESCDEVDNDCDGEIDEGVSQWYPDADGDGFGDAGAEPLVTCTPVEGRVNDHTDCDDSDPLVYPGAHNALCDGVDGDCDGQLDRGVAMVDGVAYEDFQAAVDAAPEGGTILVCPGEHEADMVVPKGRSLSFDAIYAGSVETTLIGVDSHRMLELEPGAIVTVANLTFSGGYVDGLRDDDGGGFGDDDGGAVRANDADLFISDCVFRANSAKSEGGAIYAENWSKDAHTLLVERTRFERNVAIESSGGALETGAYSSGDLDVSLSDCEFSKNQAEGSGGAIEAHRGSPLTISGSHFYDNFASSDGGAITAHSLAISNSEFTENSAGYAGGAIIAYTLAISESELTENSAGYEGGAINAHTVAINSSEFTENSAGYEGGVLSTNSCSYDDACSVSISSSNVEANSCYEGLGVINVDSLEGAASIVMEESTFTGNSAGPVLHGSEDRLSLSVSGCTFAGNTSDGVGVFALMNDMNEYGLNTIDMLIEDSVIMGNEALSWSAAFVDAYDSIEITFRRCEIRDNFASVGTTMAFNEDGSMHGCEAATGMRVVFEDTTIEDNDSTQGESAFLVGATCTHDNVEVIRGVFSGNASDQSAVRIPAAISLTSRDSDWGEGGDDNIPCDLVLDEGDESYLYFCSLGSDETFTCPGDGTCE
jgi:predicted outer membrane repeat protein